MHEGHYHTKEEIEQSYKDEKEKRIKIDNATINFFLSSKVRALGIVAMVISCVLFIVSFFLMFPEKKDILIFHGMNLSVFLGGLFLKGYGERENEKALNILKNNNIAT